MEINLSNYLFFNDLQYIKYKPAIHIYKQNIINQKKVNDITRIILLFFPHLIRSNSLKLNDSHKNLEYFDYSKLKFENELSESKRELEVTIKDFFFHYNNLESERKFKFHRREMINYLESFLVEYSQNEKVTEEEKRTGMIYHNFRTFLKPEEYLVHKEKEEKE